MNFKSGNSTAFIPVNMTNAPMKICGNYKIKLLKACLMKVGDESYSILVQMVQF